MAELKRILGLPTLTFYGIGMILGAGIYSVIGKAAGLAGEGLWLSFAVAAICAALTALSYAELSSMIPKAGAEYSFLSHVFPRHRWLATTSGLMMAFSAFATAAAVGLAFSEYLSNFVALPIQGTAAGLIVLFSLLNVYGIRESSRINVVFTLIEISGLLIIIFLGFSSPRIGQAVKIQFSPGILPAASLIFFAYLGFENLVNFTEEARNPVRDIPKAVMISLIGSTLLYLLVSFSALALLSPEQLSASSAPLMDAAMKSSTVSGEALGMIALFSTANTVLIALLAGSRILYGIARGNDLPQLLAKVHSKRGTPWVAGLVTMAFALLLLRVGSVEVAASLASFATMVSFALVNIALIVLRYTQPDTERPFRVPLSVGKLPIPTVAGLLTILVLLLEFEPLVYGLFTIFFGAVVFIYFTSKNGHLTHRQTPLP